MQYDRIQQLGNSAQGKRQYATPTLVCHGLIRDLTQGGTGSISEGGTQPNCNNNGASMRVCPPASDIRLKHEIQYVGEYVKGIALYLFSYKPEFKAVYGEGTYLGVMAQDVLTILPSAVVTSANGYLAVDYAELRKLRS